uniref:Tonsoku-like protein n=2 Tax=Haemonchus contortus TaxID=6289 RepID=A0A7I4XYK0_HAECO
MRKRRREEELRKEISRTTDETKQLDLVNELGDLYRIDGDLEAARNCYKRAVQLATNLRNHLDLSFAHRALSEICAEEGDRREALEHASLFRQTAQRSGSHSQIQLSLHVTGWVYEKLHMQQSHNTDDLEEALSWGLKSIDYLKKFGHRIDTDKKAVRVGGDSARRKAGLERLCSGLCANLHRKSEAEKYWNSAYAYAKRAHDAELEYQLLLARIDFSWESPVNNAQRLVNFAPTKKKGYALMELAQVLMYVGDFLNAQNALFECLLHHRSSLTAEDAELLDARVIFLYKYFYRLDRSKSSDCDRKERRRMYELIADSFCSYGGERKEIFEHALKFYKLMFQDSVTDKEKFNAAISVAQTFMDLEDPDDALEWFEKALLFEKKLGRSEIKLCETRALIFKTKASCPNTSMLSLRNEFDLLNSDIPEECPSLKATIYEAMGQYLLSNKDEDAAVYLARAKQFGSEVEVEESCEDDDSGDVSDDVEARPDKAILAECMEMARLRNSDREIEKDRDKEKNAHGETRLHIAARSNDTAMVDKLIAAGYDVNKRDYGGWTPISEAVSAGMRDNVRALLKAGAKVDPVSTEVLNDDENSTGGGITPLMEACDKGFTDIIKDLLKCGASVVKKNADGWTAVDFLRNFLVSCESEDERYIKELTSIAVSMEEQQRKLSFPVRGCAPSRQKSTGTRSLLKTSQPKLRSTDETIDLKSYKRVIGGLGAQSKKNARSSRPRNENALFYEDDDLTSSYISPHFDDDVDLPSDCEDIGRKIEGYSIAPSSYSPLPTSQTTAFSPLKERRVERSSTSDLIKDHFLINDLEEKRRRKRKICSSSASSEPAKRPSNPFSSQTSLIVDDRSPSPECIIRKSHCRSSRGSIPSRTESPSQFCVDLPVTSSAPLSTAGPPIVVTLKFENEDGGVLRPDKLVSLPRTATMATVEERFRSELSSQKSQYFDVRLFDGRDADPEIPLLSLGEPLTVVCRLHKLTAEMLYKNSTEIPCDGDVVPKCMAKFDASGILDLSSTASEGGDVVESILKVVVNANRSINRLVLDGCDLSNEVLSALVLVLPNVEQFSCKYAGFIDEHLTSLDWGSHSLRSLNLSHNEFTSGSALSHSLLANCPQLSELRISDLGIAVDEEALVTAISELPNLQLLDISFNRFIRGNTVETLLSSCNNLTSLRMDGCDLSGVSFVSTWLPNLRELSMVGCRVTYFDSLIEWLSMGCVQQLDLSATDITLCHVRTMVESRLMCPAIVVRLVKCREIEHDPRAFADMVLAFVTDHSFPLRFSFSSQFAAGLQAITAFASNFLV